MLVNEWRVALAEQPDGIYVCLDCGAINTNYLYVCAECEAKAEARSEPIETTKGGSLE